MGCVVTKICGKICSIDLQTWNYETFCDKMILDHFCLKEPHSANFHLSVFSFVEAQWQPYFTTNLINFTTKQTVPPLGKNRYLRQQYTIQTAFWWKVLAFQFWTFCEQNLENSLQISAIFFPNFTLKFEWELAYILFQETEVWWGIFRIIIGTIAYF